MQSHLYILSLNCWAIDVPFIKLLSMPLWSIVFLIYSWINFIVPNLALRSLIQLELMLVWGERLGYSFSLFFFFLELRRKHDSYLFFTESQTVCKCGCIIIVLRFFLRHSLRLVLNFQSLCFSFLRAGRVAQMVEHCLANMRPWVQKPSTTKKIFWGKKRR
jgi:hypothetical protein